MIEIIPGVEVAATRRVRVTRTLVFEGPAEWIRETLAKRWLNGPQSPGNLAHEDKFAGEHKLVIEVL